MAVNCSLKPVCCTMPPQFMSAPRTESRQLKRPNGSSGGESGRRGTDCYTAHTEDETVANDTAAAAKWQLAKKLHFPSKLGRTKLSVTVFESLSLPFLKSSKP